MKDCKNMNDNIRANRWRARYNSLPEDIKKKLDDLADTPIKEYQLQVIKRKKIYPEIGDIFRLCPRENIEYYGLVVNNHVNNRNGEDLIVIFVFKGGINIEQALISGITRDDLLVDPEIVGKEYWNRGYFFNVGHVDAKVTNYGFFDIFDKVFYNEYEQIIENEPLLLGTYGVATISGIAYGINKEMIISGII